MDDTRYQFPSVTVSRRHSPNAPHELIARYDGEARKLLYELKNLMTFQKLGQLKMTRFFMDGTIITAHSVFGQDFLYIDTSRTVLDELVLPALECTITLFNVPDVIQPMRYPGEIRPDEVEGVDYIKTYYTVDFAECRDCLLKWNMLGAGASGSPVILYKLFNPFIFHDKNVKEWIDERRDFYGYGPNPNHPYVDASLIRPDDHCIWGNCAGEIIEVGADEGGTWIKWKAYTEYSYTHPYEQDYTRTGFGIMELMPYVGNRIINPDWTPEKAYVGMEAVLFTEEICKDAARVIVDCCKKDKALRPAVLQWGKCVVGDLCPAPDVAKMTDLLYFQHWSWIMMLLKMGGNGCFPYKWTLKGIGELIYDGPENKQVTYKVSMQEFFERGCHDDLIIEGQDRCGTSDSILFESCCKTATPLAISYTSLLMSCSGSQTLTAIGGCAPYSWNLSGGGTVTPITQDGSQAIYTAPSSNPNCTLNPTITVTDCCGSSATIRLAVNCWTSQTTALTKFHKILCAPCTCVEWSGGRCVFYQYRAVYCNWRYDCAGNLFDTCFYDGIPKNSCECATVSTYFGCNPNNEDCENGVCGGCQNINCSGGLPFSHTRLCMLYDARTAAMKEGGCCPINPITGEPY